MHFPVFPQNMSFYMQIPESILSKQSFVVSADWNANSFSPCNSTFRFLLDVRFMSPKVLYGTIVPLYRLPWRQNHGPHCSETFRKPSFFFHLLDTGFLSYHQPVLSMCLWQTLASGSDGGWDCPKATEWRCRFGKNEALQQATTKMSLLQCYFS